MTQNAKLLSYLKSGKSITQLEALKEIGSLRLGARIFDLRKKGWPIHTDRKDIGDNRTVGEYSMGRDGWPE